MAMVMDRDMVMYWLWLCWIWSPWQVTARDLLIHMELLFMAMLWELLDTLVMPKAMSAKLSMVTQEAIFLARDQLMLNPLLELILIFTMVLMVKDMLMENMDILMTDTDITTARGHLILILRQLLI